jgi:ABC-type glycerol-3-phosphate transport system substrate-binding protein
MYDAVHKKMWAPIPDANYNPADMLANGSIAMASGGRWYSTIAKRSGFENVVPCYIPTKYSDKKALAYGSYYVSSTTKHYDDVADFVVWTGGAEYQNGYIEISGNPASRRDVNTVETLPFQFEHSEIFSDIPDTAVSMENPVFFSSMEQIMFTAYSSMLAKETTPREAAQNAATQLEKELSRNPIDYLKPVDYP